MPTLHLYPFRFRDPLTGKWVRARYRLQVPEIQRHSSEWEITGLPEVRHIGRACVGAFNPFEAKTMTRAIIVPLLLYVIFVYDPALAETMAQRANTAGCLYEPEVVEGETYKCTSKAGTVYFNCPAPDHTCEGSANLPKAPPAPSRPKAPPVQTRGDRWAVLVVDEAKNVTSVDRLSIASAGTAGHRKGWFKTEYVAGRTVYTPEGSRQVEQDKQLVYADCVGRRIATKQSISYGKNSQVLESYVLPDSVVLNYADVIPDSIGENMIAALCGGTK